MTRVLGRVIMGATEGRAPILDLPRFRSGVLRAILAIKGSNHGLGRIWQRYTSCEFKRDAVRIATTSARKRQQSGFEQWPIDPGDQLACEWFSRRMEGGAKKGGDGLCGSKAMQCQYIAEYRGGLIRRHLCRLISVTERSLRDSKHQPAVASKPSRRSVTSFGSWT